MFFVDEHQCIHDRIMAGDTSGALEVLEELDEMSRDDKVHKIESFMEIVLLHLIKYAVEQPPAPNRSWDNSLRYATVKIRRINRRQKARAGSRYLTVTEIEGALEESWEAALIGAASEDREGKYTPTELAAMIEGKKAAILAAALQRIETER